MPCITDDMGETEREQRAQIQKLTRMLCTACKFLEANDVFPGGDKQLSKWWKEHQDKDEQRKANEQKEKDRENLVTNALKKLSKKEKEALGL